MSLPTQAKELFHRTFGGPPAVITAAPGRIEFIGNHTDYNAGTVLGAAIDRQVVVAARRRAEPRLSFVSDRSPAVVTVKAQPPVRQQGDASWTNYPLGVLVALTTRGLRWESGLELAVVSDLPVGAGLSSSAALELSTALALTTLAGFELPREELVKASREAENEFVGVPTGILDQGVSAFGRRDHLVHIDCRGPVFATVPLPGGVRFWIFNTHTKHALVDSLYATRNRECRAAAAALKVQWLADLTPDQVRAARERLPREQWRRATHVVEEIARVEKMRDVLARGDLAAAGRLLSASHASSSKLFENSTPELDCLVEALDGADGVYGARLTGGGFGGAVMALTSQAFTAEGAERVARRYAERFGQRPEILPCATGDGAHVVKE